jgi:hypothetical protein
MRGALLLLAILFLVSACASSSPTPDSPPAANSSSDEKISEVLSPVSDPTKAVAEKVPNPNYVKLMELLSGLGIKGVGLEYEEEPGLLLLIEVFSDPQIGQFDVALVYTGLEMSYDRNHKSLTVGGVTQASAVLAYMIKKVPRRKAVTTSEPEPVLAPELAPMKKTKPSRAVPKKPLKAPKKSFRKAKPAPLPKPTRPAPQKRPIVSPPITSPFESPDTKTLEPSPELEPESAIPPPSEPPQEASPVESSTPEPTPPAFNSDSGV